MKVFEARYRRYPIHVAVSKLIYPTAATGGYMTNGLRYYVHSAAWQACGGIDGPLRTSSSHACLDKPLPI